MSAINLKTNVHRDILKGISIDLYHFRSPLNLAGQSLYMNGFLNMAVVLMFVVKRRSLSVLLKGDWNYIHLQDGASLLKRSGEFR
jgi:hypothetical protein